MTHSRANDNSHLLIVPLPNKARDILNTTSTRSSSQFHVADKFSTPHCIVFHCGTVGTHNQVHSVSNTDKLTLISNSRECSNPDFQFSRVMPREARDVGRCPIRPDVSRNISEVMS